MWQKHAPPKPKVDVLIEHIDHVVKLAGVDCAGLGFDYDGTGGFPEGMQDVRTY